MPNSRIEYIICDYRNIIVEDGPVTKEQLLEMLEIDNYIPLNLQNVESLSKIADKILNKAFKMHEKHKNFERRIKLYNQGFSINEIAKIEGAQYNCIKYWFKSNGFILNSNKKDRSTAMETAKSKRTA